MFLLFCTKKEITYFHGFNDCCTETQLILWHTYLDSSNFGGNLGHLRASLRVEHYNGFPVAFVSGRRNNMLTVTSYHRLLEGNSWHISERVVKRIDFGSIWKQTRILSTFFGIVVTIPIADPIHDSTTEKLGLDLSHISVD